LQFEKTYGYLPHTFTPPAQQLHPDLYAYISQHGIKGVDKMRSVNRHTGQGRYVHERNMLGAWLNSGCVTVVRNCVFEPNDSAIDWVAYTLRQIRAAFFWGKPAIISSHRVNFCGHIDPENRVKGLAALRNLLKRTVQAFPDVEFMAVDELVDRMQAK
jgi:hypothetical protein